MPAGRLVQQLTPGGTGPEIRRGCAVDELSGDRPSLRRDKLAHGQQLGLRILVLVGCADPRVEGDSHRYRWRSGNSRNGHAGYGAHRIRDCVFLDARHRLCPLCPRCRLRRCHRQPHVACATGDYDADPQNPLPDMGPALRRWRLRRRPFSGNVCLPMPVQRRLADAETSSDIPKCATCSQSLIDGPVLGMGTDSAQPSHLSPNDSTMSRKTLALNPPGRAPRTVQRHGDLRRSGPRYVTSVRARLSICAL